MFRSFSFKGIAAVCAIYAIAAFAIEIIDGTLEITALAPLFTGEHPNAVIPKAGDPAWMLPLRMMGLGVLVLTFGGMFIYLVLQAFIPVTIGMVLVTLVLRRIGNLSYAAYALGGLVCGVAICSIALTRWNLNWQTALFIAVYFALGAVIYRWFAGEGAAALPSRPVGPAVRR